ncbi:hypothetical protein [Hydrogenophaga sp. 5NK40-0174]|uniref:hypothetical protein n=1 Tax=Hydrogenophaga sp. 5NK40-0174 TaxID=3127649 RepID=UPI00310B4E71
MKFVLALCAALALTACASSKPYWAKPGVSSDTTYNELSQCRYEVGLRGIDGDEADLLIAHCMRGKGYRLLANQDEI